MMKRMMILCRILHNNKIVLISHNKDVYPALATASRQTDVKVESAEEEAVEE
jgi:hypothetical protein